MRRGRMFIVIGLILILGLVAAGVLFVRNQQTAPPVGVEGLPVATPEVILVSVVVMAQSVKQGERITEDVLAVVQIPKAEFKEGVNVTEEEMAEIIGTFARRDLPAESYPTHDLVLDKTGELAGSDHALLIPPGMVAVSIPVDRLASVAYGVRRGDHVNVIVTLLMVDLDASFQTKLPNSSSSVLAPGPGVVLGISTDQGEGKAPSVETTIEVNELLQTLTAQIITGGATSPIGRLELDQSLGQPFYVVPSEPEKGQRPRLVSQTLIQNVIVLQMGDFVFGDQPVAVATPGPVDENAPTAVPADSATVPVDTQAKAPDTVTLIVSPQDAVTLNYLLGYFPDAVRLSLALRSAGDDTQTTTEAVTLQFLLDQYSIPVPAKLPFGLEPRIDMIVPPLLPNDIVPTPEQ